MFRRTFLAVLALSAIAVPAAAQEGKTINIGLISTETSSNLKAAWQPVIDDLSKALGMQVKPFFASDYAGIIEGMRFNKVQVARSATSRRSRRSTAPAAKCSLR